MVQKTERNLQNKKERGEIQWESRKGERRKIQRHEKEGIERWNKKSRERVKKGQKYRKLIIIKLEEKKKNE